MRCLLSLNLEPADAAVLESVAESLDMTVQRVYALETIVPMMELPVYIGAIVDVRGGRDPSPILDLRRNSLHTDSFQIILITDGISQIDARWQTRGALSCIRGVRHRAQLQAALNDLIQLSSPASASEVDSRRSLSVGMMDAMETLIGVLDDRGHILYVNEAARRLMRLPSAGMEIGERFFDLIYKGRGETQMAQEHFDLIVSHLDPSSSRKPKFEVISEVEGELHVMDWWVTPLVIGDMHSLMVQGQDVTDLYTMEQKSHKLLAELKVRHDESELNNRAMWKLNEQFSDLVRFMRQYTPRYTWSRAEEVVTGGGNIIPQEERDLTMVFGDLQGFTRFSERHTPVEVVASLNEVFEIVSEVIYSNGGDIDKFIGDAFFAVFTDPERAVISALTISRRIDELNDDRMMRGAAPMFMRFGINTGRVIRGDVGGRLRKENTIIGDAVNVAQRLESKAIAGQVVISETTYEYVKHIVTKGDLVELPLKGRDEPIQAFYVQSSEWHKQQEELAAEAEAALHAKNDELEAAATA